jgi:tetratricopeptide (TPR) repeat protein
LLRSQAKKLEEETKKKPRDSASWTRLGYVYLEQERHEVALQMFEKATELGGGKESRVHRSVGHCHFVLDDVEKARTSYSQAIKKHREEQRVARRGLPKSVEEQTVPPPMLMMYRLARMDMRRMSWEKAYKRLQDLVDQSSPGPFDTFVQQQEVSFYS